VLERFARWTGDGQNTSSDPDLYFLTANLQHSSLRRKIKTGSFPVLTGRVLVYFRLIGFDVKSPLLSFALTSRVILYSSGLICSISESGKNLATIGR
jgi:hypothetical protein